MQYTLKENPKKQIRIKTTVILYKLILRTFWCMYFLLNVCVYLCAWASLVAGKESAWHARDPSSIPGSGRYTGEGIGYPLQYSWASLVVKNPQMVKNPPQCGRPGFNSWVGRIPWRRAWQPTPVFLPGNPKDRGAWRATVHGVEKSRTRLSG